MNVLWKEKSVWEFNWMSGVDMMSVTARYDVIVSVCTPWLRGFCYCINSHYPPRVNLCWTLAQASKQIENGGWMLWPTGFSSMIHSTHLSAWIVSDERQRRFIQPISCLTYHLAFTKKIQIDSIKFQCLREDIYCTPKVTLHRFPIIYSQYGKCF